MPSQTLHTEAFVLTKGPSAADNWLTYHLFSSEQGPLHALQRQTKKPSKSQVALDLFDEAALELESANQGRTWFIRGGRILTRNSDIGRSYEALRSASTFARMIVRNPVAPESRIPVGNLVRAALAAFATAARPDIVLFKSLYRFARDEGYPVKQEWFPGLSVADQDTVALLLNRPLPEQTIAADVVARLQKILEAYLRDRTEIIVEG